MCGRLNVTDSPFVIALMTELGIPLDNVEPRFNRYSGVAQKISIVREVEGQRRLDAATWWLLLEPTEEGFKPSKYTSFNTRYDKLNVPRSAGYKAFRESRCIIVASGFGETEGKGANARYHDFFAVDSAIAFGGLCREWFHKSTGEVSLSCSIITLPPHDKIKAYHTKASPLMLPQKDHTMDMWLDYSFHDVEAFNDLLKPHIPQNLEVQQIDKPSKYNPIGVRKLIQAD
jgi:putative SOS response-associated peptidase YedK